MKPAAYRCEGGPLNGRIIEPPPEVLRQVTEQLAEQFGGEQAGVRIGALALRPILDDGEEAGGEYRADDDFPGVLFWHDDVVDGQVNVVLDTDAREATRGHTRGD